MISGNSEDLIKTSLCDTGVEVGIVYVELSFMEPWFENRAEKVPFHIKLLKR